MNGAVPLIFVSVHDKDFRIIRANKALTDFSGMAYQELIGTHCYELMCRSNRAIRACPHRKDLNSNQSVTDYIHDPRTFKYYQLSCSPFSDDNGTFIGSVLIAKDITESKQAENAALESERKFRELADLLPQVVFETDEKGMFTYVNKYAMETTGYTEEDIANGLNCIETFVPEDRERGVENFRRRMQGEDVGGIEYRMLKKGGGVLRTIVRADRILKDGRPAGIRGVVVDITEIRKAEKLLEERELKYRTLFEQSPYAVVLIDPETTLPLDFNDRFCDLLGHSREELGHLHMADYEAAENPDEVKSHIQKVLTVGEYEFETCFRTKTGELRDILAHIKVIEIKGRKCFHNIFKDITDQKNAEKTINELNMKYQAVVSTSPIGIAICDASGQAILVNDAMAEIAGATNEQVLSQNYHDIESWKTSGVYEKAISAARSKTCEHLDVSLTTSFGKKVDLSCHFIPLDSGEMIFMFSDISAMVRSERLLKQALADKDVLIKEVHHRVKNNLAVIQSLLRLQSRQIEDEESRERFLESQNRIKTMALIHEQLYRTENLSNINVADYFYSMTNMLFKAYTVGASKVKHIVDVADIKIDIDVLIPLGLIVNELMSNALKYAFSDTENGELFMGLSAGEDNTFILVVKDNGTGIPEGLDIYSTKSLGMQIVTSLTEQIGGTLELNRNNGTEFRITVKQEPFNRGFAGNKT
jgi:PAS domain S-box-containing protein